LTHTQIDVEIEIGIDVEIGIGIDYRYGYRIDNRYNHRKRHSSFGYDGIESISMRLIKSLPNIVGKNPSSDRSRNSNFSFHIVP